VLQASDAEEVVFHVFIHSLFDHIVDVLPGHICERLAQESLLVSISLSLTLVLRLSLVNTAKARALAWNSIRSELGMRVGLECGVLIVCVPS
jgi:hypothetical protein